MGSFMGRDDNGIYSLHGPTDFLKSISFNLLGNGISEGLGAGFKHIYDVHDVPFFNQASFELVGASSNAVQMNINEKPKK